MVPPLPAGCRYLGRYMGRYVCGFCVQQAYGTRHATRARVRRRANNTTEPPHDRVRRCLCVLLPRPRPANLAGRCGIPKTRDNEGVSQKQFRVRDHLRDITRHHVIVVTKFIVVGASWTSIGRSALVGLPRATLPVRSPVTHSHSVPHRTTFAQDCHRSSHETQADFVINGSPVLRDRVRTLRAILEYHRAATTKHPTCAFVTGPGSSVILIGARAPRVSEAWMGDRFTRTQGLTLTFDHCALSMLAMSCGCSPKPLISSVRQTDG